MPKSPRQAGRHRTLRIPPGRAEALGAAACAGRLAPEPLALLPGSAALPPQPQRRCSASARPGSASSGAPLLPRACWLWESGGRQGAGFAVSGTPPSGRRGKGERGHGQVLGGSQRCRLRRPALEGCALKGL